MKPRQSRAEGEGETRRVSEVVERRDWGFQPQFRAVTGLRLEAPATLREASPFYSTSTPKEV